MRHPKPTARWPVALTAGLLLTAIAAGASAQETNPAPESTAAATATATEAGGAAETNGNGSTASSGPAEAQIQTDAIFPTAERHGRAPWQVFGLYELHFNAWSDEYSANDWYSYYQLRGDRNLTEHDQVSLRMDMEQKYIADPGEDGLWFGDMRFYYSRFFEIPIRSFVIPAKASLYLTAPTSRASRHRGYITKPTALLTVAPKWGPLSLIGIASFRYSFAWYAESWNGDPNMQLTAGVDLQLYYQVTDWFAPSVDWNTSWSRPYDDREGNSRPVVQDYYWELAANFSIPMPPKAPSVDVSLAYAQGANVLEDGVYRLYLRKRNQSEVYGAINLTY